MLSAYTLSKFQKRWQRWKEEKGCDGGRSSTTHSSPCPKLGERPQAEACRVCIGKAISHLQVCLPLCCSPGPVLPMPDTCLLTLLHHLCFAKVKYWQHLVLKRGKMHFAHRFGGSCWVTRGHKEMDVRTSTCLGEEQREWLGQHFYRQPKGLHKNY